MRTAAALAISADPAFTYLAVRAGASEAHPLWGALIANVGLGPAMTVRLLAGLLLVAAVVVAVEHDGMTAVLLSSSPARDVWTGHRPDPADVVVVDVAPHRGRETRSGACRSFVGKGRHAPS